MLLLAVASAVLLANCDTAAGCFDGWFGKDCRYKCRCATTTSCGSDGSCTRCLPGWFGPACQYDDLAFSQETKPDAGYLTDVNDGSCATPRTLEGNQVTVILDRKYLFTWLRVHIHASATDLLHHLEVVFGPDASLPCTSPRNASLDQRTLDIHCDVDGAVQEVTLRGEAVPYLCSVYISGGRNIALKQTTSQSSTYSFANTSYIPDKAVDGNTNTDFSQRSCSTTDQEYRSPRRAEWNITFDLPSYTTRYVLYNRQGFTSRLKKFYLQSFGKMDDRVFNYTDTASYSSLTYTIIPGSVTPPVTLVNIQNNNTDKILTLCEVEIYGDSSCDVGKYGRDCEHDCWCAQGEQCFVSTGGCPSGCAPGFHGESCHTKCPSGLYGSACAYNCSQLCIPSNSSQESPCHHVTGACHLGCQNGYTGTACSTQLSNHDNMDVTVVVATVVGGVGVLVLVVIAVVFWRRRQTTKSETSGNEYKDNISLSRNDRNKVNRTLTDDGYEIPEVSKAVTQTATQMATQGNVESEYIVGDDCVVQSCDDSQARTYEEIDDNLASAYEDVVDNSNEDITSTHNSPEYADTL